MMADECGSVPAYSDPTGRPNTLGAAGRVRPTPPSHPTDRARPIATGSRDGSGETLVQWAAWLETLGRIGHGVVILDERRSPQAMNARGRAVLAEALGWPESDLAAERGVGEAVAALLARGRRRPGHGAGDWLVIERGGRRPLLVHAIGLPRAGPERSDTALILIDPETPLLVQVSAMERVFGLSPAEAQLAALLAGGISTAEVAATLDKSLATVRKQLASIFQKTGTRGQVELVVLVLQLSILP